MKAISNLLFLLCFFTSAVTIAQTPFDDFAPSTQVNPILSLPETRFRVYNPDSTNEIHYIELDKESGLLAYYDRYDSMLGGFMIAEAGKKWLSTDPMAKKHPGKSPYNFCSNDPVNRIDADGKDDFTFHTYTSICTYKINGVYQTKVKTVTSVDVVRNNSPNTYTVHNVVVTEDLTNGTKPLVGETYTDAHKNAGEYLSKYWEAISKLYPQEMSAPGTGTSFAGLKSAKESKDAYEADKKEDELKESALNIMLNFVPIGDFIEGLKIAKGTALAVEGGSTYTKSSLAYGREVHAAYKLSEHAPELGRFKEFTGIKGIRPDFVDFNTRTIYDLKPFNPTQIKLGLKQLSNYKSLFEQKYGGTWKTVLDHY